MQKADPLIRTKLHLPFTRLRLVSRPRLKSRIMEGLRHPLTLITAPAGFGKTTLAASVVADCGMQAAWLSLDKNDNREGRFLSYLVAALQEIDPMIGGEATQLLTATTEASSEAILISLINDLDAAGRELVLALDDYQFITSQAVHDEVIFLLQHCPKTFHLLIATRSDPPLPLARLRARGQTVELRVADLRFTESEASQFLNDAMGLRLDAGSVAALEQRTEGWIAGLQMAALSMRERQDVGEFIDGFSGTNRYILDYLLEEVLASQPAEIQRFLLCTAILERLTAPLCDALLPLSEMVEADGAAGPPVESPSVCQSATVLEYLERANLFLAPLDSERIWYRYHHLFADLLRARLHQAQPDLVRRLHIRASAWLEQKGLITEAIHHLFAVQETGRAADLIERYGPARLAQSDVSVFQMADMLPAEMLAARPRLGLYQAWLLILHGHIRSAIPLLNEMARQLAGAPPCSEQRWMQTIIASAQAFLSSQDSPADAYALPDAGFLDEIPAEEPLLRNAADLLYVMAQARRGNIEGALDVSTRCIQRERQQQEPAGILTLAPFLSRFNLMLGHSRATATLCREFLDPIKDKGGRCIYSAGGMKIDLGEALYEWNCLDEAEQYIRAGLQDNEPWRNIMTEGFGLIALARVLRATGDYAGAMQAVEKLETTLQTRAQPREFDEDFHTLRVRVQLASGDLQTASRWADQIQRSPDFESHQDRYRLTLAGIRLAQGKYAEVERLLGGMTPGITAGSRITRQLERNLLLAAAIAGQQRLPEALELFDSSLALAEPDGYIRIFLDVGEPARELLAAYLRLSEPGHKAFAQTIIRASSSPGRSGVAGPPSDDLIEPLSGRELEVLCLMALGRTNQEIARQLIVSTGTVKAHTASIYGKLGVANRTEAAARARQLGLLP
jgi:LuxR family maltose regulon positive regulatory protein